MKLEFIPVREQESHRSVPGRRRGVLRLYFIIWDGAKTPMSGGYTLGVAPSV